MYPIKNLAESNFFPVSEPAQSNSANQSRWNCFYSPDSFLLDNLNRMTRNDPALKDAIDSLNRSLNLKIEFRFMDNAEFRGHTGLQFAVSNAERGVHVKERNQTRQQLEQIFELAFTSKDKFVLPEKELTFAIRTIAQKNQSGVWPPQFAVLDRPEKVQAASLQALQKIPVSEIRKLGAALVHDLSNAGYKAYHEKNLLKVVAPIMTAKVAEADTQMFQFALEREIQPGEIAFIDSSSLCLDVNKPTYANVGDMLMATAIQRGAVGFVSNGFVRDSEKYVLSEDSKVNFACWAKGETPNGPTKLEAGALNLGVLMDGHAVNTGDIFVGQGNELVIIPAKNVDGLLRSLEAMSDHAEELSVAPSVSALGEHVAQTGNTFLSPAGVTENRVSRLMREQITKITLRNTPVTKQLLQLMGKFPPAEYSDSFHTLKPPQTIGIGRISLYAKSAAEKSSGLALIVDGTRESIEKGISVAKEKHSLIIYAQDPHDIVLNDYLLGMANEKGLAAIITNGTVAVSQDSSMPVHAARYVEDNRPVTKSHGKGILTTPVTMQGVTIFPGNIIIGYKDGVSAIPEGYEAFSLRGSHAIAAKEHDSLPGIEAGTAPQRGLANAPLGLLPSGDLSNESYLQEHINGRDTPLQAPRGSSGLNIPQPEWIEIVTGNESTQLKAQEKVAGIPVDVIFNKAEPVTFKIKEKGTIKDIAVRGIEGTDFLRAMKAMSKAGMIEVDARGKVILVTDVE